MASHKILRGDMPCIDDNGKKKKISHVCHYGICVKPARLFLETHEIDLERISTVHKTAAIILFGVNSITSFCLV